MPFSFVSASGSHLIYATFSPYAETPSCLGVLLGPEKSPQSESAVAIASRLNGLYVLIVGPFASRVITVLALESISKPTKSVTATETTSNDVGEASSQLIPRSIVKTFKLRETGS